MEKNTFYAFTNVLLLSNIRQNSSFNTEGANHKEEDNGDDNDDNLIHLPVLSDVPTLVIT